jgi:hypothetical protein
MKMIGRTFHGLDGRDRIVHNLAILDEVCPANMSRPSRRFSSYPSGRHFDFQSFPQLSQRRFQLLDFGAMAQVWKTALKFCQLLLKKSTQIYQNIFYNLLFLK